jgi:hypothetical protein
LDLNASAVEFLSFEPKDYSIPACFKDPVTKSEVPVTREVYSAIIDSVKEQASSKD